jgi:4-diphosphocytidyl-2-C-methyl-D-erythritol kinase
MRYFAAAKLNRFLHIVGRRSDGYHELQTIFQRINYCDTLDFKWRQDHEIHFQLKIDPDAIKPCAAELGDQINLVEKAAHLLLSFCHKKVAGVDIILTKKIPVGAGLGGGSSDAATTLLALNQLWVLNLSKEELMALGLQLGADVPFFMLEQSAWGEGVGEKLTPLTLPQAWFLVVVPEVSISTVTIFSDPALKRDTPVVQQDRALLEIGHNDCEPVVRRLYPEVAEVIDVLSTFSPARMTGSGACVFAVFEQKAAAEAVALKLPAVWRYFIAESLDTF